MNNTSQVTTDDNYFFGKVSYKLYLNNWCFVDIVEGFLMFKVYIAKQVFEGVFKKPLVLGLTFLQLPLLKKTFNLIDGNLAFGVAWHNKKILIFF